MKLPKLCPVDPGRAVAIRVLGMDPEPKLEGRHYPHHPEAYAATSSELITWARKKLESEGRDWRDVLP